MTVCVAAIARDSHIVTASDTLISFGAYGSADATSVKLEGFHDSWATMMAADDITHCPAIIESATENLRGKDSTLRAVTSGFKHAYKEYLSELAADRVLGRFGMGMKEFREKGIKRFTPDIFNVLSNEIRDVKLDCSFLVFGYDEKRQPHIFTVDYPGVLSNYDKPGFCAIGLGSFAAWGMLFTLKQSVDSSLHETIFNVYAAKFMAESPGQVGEHTYFFVKEYGCDAWSYPANLEATMRAWWNKEKPKRDEGILNQIRARHFAFMPIKKGESNE